MVRVAYGEADPHQPVANKTELFVYLQPNYGILTELFCRIAMLDSVTELGGEPAVPGKSALKGTELSIIVSASPLFH